MIRSTTCAVMCLVLTSCIAAGPTDPTASHSRYAYRREALEVLKRAAAYRANPAVRAQAVEAFSKTSAQAGLPWIRAALDDDHPGVRFAACMVLGTMRDGVAESRFRRLLDDADDSVRVAAVFALHRLGDTTHTGRLASDLLDHSDAAVRRNAAMAIGRLGEPGAIELLARAMRDEDDGVRFHALEGMALLGAEEARRQLAFDANSGVGSDEVMSLNALADTRNPLCRETFFYKLGAYRRDTLDPGASPHTEVAMAAIRGLGLLGIDDGLDLAVCALRFNDPRTDDPDDPPAGQVLRVRQMAAAALGAIGDAKALPGLAEQMRSNPDPRVQVSAAGAILAIVEKDRQWGLPFMADGSSSRKDSGTKNP